MEEEVPKSIVTNDSNDVVSLHFMDLDPDTTFISFPGSTSADITVFHSTCHMPGNTEHPEGYNFPYQGVQSDNPNLLISFGKDDAQGKYLLTKDSAINENLTWFTFFNADGPPQCVNYQQRPDYIGLKLTKNGKTYYGWIRYANFKFAEYAMDTLGPANYGTVRAGQLERK